MGQNRQKSLQLGIRHPQVLLLEVVDKSFSSDLLKNHSKTIVFERIGFGGSRGEVVRFIAGQKSVRPVAAISLHPFRKVPPLVLQSMLDPLPLKNIFRALRRLHLVHAFIGEDNKEPRWPFDPSASK